MSVETDRPDTWELSEPRFSEDWHARPRRRYRHPRRWRWSAIYACAFWLVLAVVFTYEAAH